MYSNQLSTFHRLGKEKSKEDHQNLTIVLTNHSFYFEPLINTNVQLNYRDDLNFSHRGPIHITEYGH